MKTKIAVLIFAALISGCDSATVGTQATLTNTDTLPTIEVTPEPTVTPDPNPTPSPTPSSTPYSFGGQGTVAQPYELRVAEDVQHIGDYPSAHFALLNTIDMAGVTVTPIPTFSGVINGEHYQLNNLTIQASGSNDAALVLNLTGIIINLSLWNVTVSSQSGYATAYGDVVSGTVSGCLVLSGSITSPKGGTPIYSQRLSGSVVSSDQAWVTFNGSSINVAY